VNDLDTYLPRISAGDATAFGQWLASAEPILRDSLRSFASRVDTEAVLQEALLRLWQVAPRTVPDGRPNSFLRLGFRIAKNLAISEARRARTSPMEPVQLAESVAQNLDDPEPRFPDPLLRRVIEACRDRLPKKPALALSARLGSGGNEPDATLAERLHMRTNTFLQNITRARKLLLECLKTQGIDVVQELA